jgi:uridine phosphorylase
MPIHESYDDSSAEVLRADQLIDPVPNFPELVIVSYTRHVFRLLLENHNAVEISRMNTSAVEIPVYEIEHDGKRFATFLSTIGGAVAAALMEEAIAMGGKQFLFFGSCGVLDDTILDGHIAVPTAAWRDEGVSYHYLPAADVVEIPTASVLSRILDELHVPHHTTITWTTDAIYRETRGTVLKRKEAGCAVVEMECASTAAVAHMRGVEFYQFVFGADSLAGEEWDPRTLATFPHDQRSMLAELVVRIAAKIT